MLIDTARLFLRRWPFVVLAVLLACGAGGLAVYLTPPTYSSQAQVLFLPPTTQPGVEGKVNPFLALGAALGVTADIVRLDVSDDGTRATLSGQGAIEDYEVTPYLAENGGPILIVTAEDVDAARTKTTVALVVARIADDLRSLQASAQAPSGSYITSTPLTETPEPEKSVKDQIRAAAVVAPAVLVVLLVGIVVGDDLAGRRRRRRAERLLEEEAVPPTEDRDDDVDPERSADRSRPPVGVGRSR